MSANQQNLTPKPYDQQPDEPNKWYNRFHRYCLLGPSRTIDRCYLEITAQHQALNPSGTAKQLLKRAPRASSTWKQRAQQFDWQERAAAWDADQRQLAVKHSHEILNRIMKATLDSLQILVDMMYGQYKHPLTGEAVILDQREIRLVAKTVFTNGIDLMPLLQLNQAQERPEIIFTEFRVPLPDTDNLPNVDDDSQDNPSNKIYEAV